MSDTSQQERGDENLCVELCAIRVDAEVEEDNSLQLAETNPPDVGEGHSLLLAETDPAEGRPLDRFWNLLLFATAGITPDPKYRQYYTSAMIHGVLLVLIIFLLARSARPTDTPTVTPQDITRHDGANHTSVLRKGSITAIEPFLTLINDEHS